MTVTASEMDWTKESGRISCVAMSSLLRHSLIFALSLPVVSLLADTSEREQPANSPGSFVQSFYDWYVPASNSYQKGLAAKMAVDQRPDFFSAKLLRALKPKLAARGLGLDFDPFLNSQDPAPRYVVGSVSQDGDHQLVTVFGIMNGRKPARPDVVARVKQENGHWVFTDFRYSNGQSLKKVLNVD
jgi:hypothetical protein